MDLERAQLDLDVRLIELVIRFDHIYDKSKPLFKDRAAKDDAWKTIADKIGLTYKECEQRWTVLRSKYRLERKKYKSSGNGATCDWPLFSKLRFLDKFIMGRRKRSSLLKPTRTVPEQSSESQTPPWEFVSACVEPGPSRPPIGTTKIKDEEIEIHLDELNTANTSMKQTAPEKLRSQGENKRDQLTAIITECWQHLEKTAGTENSDIIFGKLVGAELREITDVGLKGTAKLKIMQILQDFKRQQERL